MNQVTSTHASKLINPASHQASSLFQLPVITAECRVVGDCFNVDLLGVCSVLF